MSNVLLRRNSSKKGLQKLTRLTSQRSIEDAEEAERERRQRTRNSLRQRNSGSMPEESSPDGEMQVKENMWAGDLRSSGSPIEVDEGFSDWTQRKDKPKLQQELSQGGSEESPEEELENKTVPKRFHQVFTVSSSRLQTREQKDTESIGEMERRSEHEEEAWRETEKKRDMLMSHRKEEIQKPNEKDEKHVKCAVMQQQSNGSMLEAEQRLEKIQLDLQEENQDLERLRNRQAETKQNLQQLRKRMEDQHQFQEDQDHQRKEEKQKRLEDTKGLKVGSANRILQWVNKGPSDGCSRHSTFRPITVKPGDVMQKKNMWEIIGDSSGSLEQQAKPSAAGKKYKFVITGHGKYEKIPAENQNDDEPK